MTIYCDENGNDFYLQPLPELISYIRQYHHRFIRQHLPEINNHCSEILKADAETYPELHEIQYLLRVLDEDLNSHIEEEEKRVFPYIVTIDESLHNQCRECAAPALSGESPLSRLSSHHRQSADVLNRIRELTHDFHQHGILPAHSKIFYVHLNEFDLNLHEHSHLESNILHPRALETETKVKQGHFVSPIIVQPS